MRPARIDPLAERADFPAFSQPGNHFLDSAASAQKPAVVLEAMSEFAGHSYANVHRGAYRLSLQATDRYEAARQRVAAFVGAADSDEVVLVRGTTSALNLVAQGWGGAHLRPGDRIVLTELEHHANLVPWQMVARRTGARLDFVPLTDDYRLDLEAFHRLLDTDVKMVAVSGMSNVLGIRPPVAEMAAAAHEVGARMVVDGAQLVVHSPTDVTTLGADAIAFSAHKLLGPTGIGALWGRRELLEEMEPVEGGGEMISDVTLHTARWAAVPHRFEAGTPPIIESVGFHAALDYLESIGMAEVATHDAALTAHALTCLAAVPGVRVLGPGAGPDRGGLVSFTMGDIHAHDLATILDQHGVSVRAGHHCAKPLMRRLGVPATARASFSVYNGSDDIEALGDGLRHAGRLFGVT